MGLGKGKIYVLMGLGKEKIHVLMGLGTENMINCPINVKS